METASAGARPNSNRSMPPGSIIPELAYDDVLEAARWLCNAFGFRERLRIGTHRVQLVHGGESIVVIERSGGTAADESRTHALMVRVEDVDAHFSRARTQGVHVLSTPETHPFGERQYSAQDPGGHIWTCTQFVADLDRADW